MRKNNCVVVIPVYKSILSHLEEKSLTQCFKVLSNYEIIIIHPSSLNINAALRKFGTYKTIPFDDLHFNSINSYNKLLLRKDFYERFIPYEYILLYQTDAYVFQDKLDHWTSAGYSYVGAPWLNKDSYSIVGRYGLNVGNGGFSLRKVSDFLKVLEIRKSFLSINECCKLYGGISIHLKWVLSLNIYLFKNKISNLYKYPPFNEDIIFSLLSRKFSFFTVPSLEDALDFAFETDPSQCFTLNNSKLPFGCHAWWRYDYIFWEKYIT